MPTRPPLRRAPARDPNRQALAEATALAQLEMLRGKPAAAAPPRAGAFAAAVVKPLLGETGLTLSELKRRWPEIVGEKFAQMTEPEKLVKGAKGATLTVRAAAAAAPFVQHQIPLVKERCALAGGAITEIIIRQGPPARPAARNVRPILRPLSAEDERALQAALARVEDPGLKRALLRLARAVAARES
jgi:hypothetical protein